MIFSPNKFLKIAADPISIIPWGYGGILPVSNSSGIVMENASVIFEIHAIKKNVFDINFNGNYIFFNTNITQSILIGAPFGFELEDNITNIRITVNDTIIPYELIRIEEEYCPQWNDFLGSYYGSREFIINNITFQSNYLTSISYSFSLYIDSGYAINWIKYDVGTSRAWGENITESVDFRVHGVQPGSYSSGCIIAKIENGKSYSWQWIDTVIWENNVGIRYDQRSFIDKHSVVFMFLFYYGIPALILGAAIFIIIFLIKRKNKNKTKTNF